MMSSNVVVSVQELTKSYKLLNTPKSQVLNLLGFPVPTKPVLNGITFDIVKGEKVGILGVNGAGKSTLLNIVAGMSKPTGGSVTVKGEIGAILELGAGFHPDLTGMQNAEMLLALRGVPRRKIPEVLTRIMEFSELGVDIESKVRTYSSGMLVRLAFATACAVTPDLFIVDEALAVGDARFQQKCYDFLLNSMSDGTLLLISHDMSAISAICDRVIILSEGQVAFDGHPSEGIVAYNRISQVGRVPQVASASTLDSKKSGPCDIDILEAEFLVNGVPARVVSGGDVVGLRMRLDNHLSVSDVVTGFNVLDMRGQKIFGQTSSNKSKISISPGLSEVEMEFVWPKLAPGSYSVTVGVGQGPLEGIQVIQCWINNCFEIENSLGEMSHGLFNIDLKNLEIRALSPLAIGG